MQVDVQNWPRKWLEGFPTWSWFSLAFIWTRPWLGLDLSSLLVGIRCAILGCLRWKMTNVKETWWYLWFWSSKMAVWRQRFNDDCCHGYAINESLGQISGFGCPPPNASLLLWPTSVNPPIILQHEMTPCSTDTKPKPSPLALLFTTLAAPTDVLFLYTDLRHSLRVNSHQALSWSSTISCDIAPKFIRSMWYVRLALNLYDCEISQAGGTTRGVADLAWGLRSVVLSTVIL